MYQKLSIIGNLGQEPDINYTPSGQMVVNFSVATNRKWTESDGQQQEETIWFRVSAWGKLGETCQRFLSKGDTVFVEGRLNLPNDRNDNYGMTALEVKFVATRSSKVKAVNDTVEKMVDQVVDQRVNERVVEVINERTKAIEITCINCGEKWKTRDKPHAYCPNCNIANYVPY